ncbi:hypothetical protein M405DRAFT_857052 [Rhizopogon salebrosus TDB-379]|nr:hypothetical protein M405DRAFT_857052 [Rhizopogon salebrosus TDB-379]
MPHQTKKQLAADEIQDRFFAELTAQLDDDEDSWYNNHLDSSSSEDSNSDSGMDLSSDSDDKFSSSSNIPSHW